MTREEKIKLLESLPSKRHALHSEYATEKMQAEKALGEKLSAIDKQEVELSDQIEITELDILEITKGKPKVGQEIPFYGKIYKVTGVGKDKNNNTLVGWEKL